MNTAQRLSQVLATAREIPIDDSSRLIFFSDIHRGDDSPADEFAQNQVLLVHALDHYFNAGFTYVEIGDGDELLENKEIEEIKRFNAPVFQQMRKFHQAARLHFLYGNHNLLWRDPAKRNRHLKTLFNEATEGEEPLFEAIEIVEALVLRYSPTRSRILVVHGHQGDFWNESLWWLSSFALRRLWRPLQLMGVSDPTRPSKNKRKRGIIERAIAEWIRQTGVMVICGHTHRAMFPRSGELPYFNTGCCIHPRRITGIELEGGHFQLVQWGMGSRADGSLYVNRETLAGPRPISRFSAFLAGLPRN
jgi:UDP-2,3-diacylglucosamine pyrophosphatase LpxH